MPARRLDTYELEQEVKYLAEKLLPLMGGQPSDMEWLRWIRERTEYATKLRDRLIDLVGPPAGPPLW